ncbi:transcription factor CTF1 [Xylariaceae sp. FL1019]|nr:transcription factor CTF1 [Xylariaceae sp. FL1019]
MSEHDEVHAIESDSSSNNDGNNNGGNNNDGVNMAIKKFPRPRKSSTNSHERKPKDSTSSKKRAAVTAPDGSVKVIKRRAAQACKACRSRKVRCDVVEGSPCGNCKWDGQDCYVEESRRRKKGIVPIPGLHPRAAPDNGTTGDPQHAEAQLPQAESVLPNEGSNAPNSMSLNGTFNIAPTPRRYSTAHAATAHDDVGPGMGIKRTDTADSRTQKLLTNPNLTLDPTLQSLQPNNPVPGWIENLIPSSGATFSAGADLKTPSSSQLDLKVDTPELPGFIRPLPENTTAEDVEYLRVKGALSLPSISFQDRLLRAYIEYVHPYMPLVELHDLLSIIDARDGSRGQISLFLYQAIMFSAVVFVDSQTLRENGYPSTKVARRVLFHQTRLLYDMDYESDRLVLIQGLLLMSYWYQTPDDQKDTWHWMGVATSLAHSIGLHRDTATRQNMTPQTQKLWKRVWWSCYMRDRLVALGMRRPTRIKDEDFDVPMLEIDDFEIGALPDDINVVSPECLLLRNVEMQHDLAQMCIAKAKLCVCISHILKAQYSVSTCSNAQPENTINSSMMLSPNEPESANMDAVGVYDRELIHWMRDLLPCCEPRPLESSDLNPGRVTMLVQRNLLHLTYYTAVSALHRPQFLRKGPKVTDEAQIYARLRVWESARSIKDKISSLLSHDLVKYLPTTSVTVILPAMIIQMLQMKVPIPSMQEEAKQGFKTCMMAMEILRKLYMAAEYAMAFLSAAMNKCLCDPKSMQRAQSYRRTNRGEEPSNIQEMNLSLPLQYPNTVGFAQSGLNNMTTPPPDSTSYPMESQTLPDFEGLSSLDAYATQRDVPPAGTVEPSVLHTGENAEISMNGAGHGVVPPHSPPLSENMEIDGALPDEHAAGAANTDQLNTDLNSILAGDQPADFDWTPLGSCNLNWEEFLHFPPATEEPLPAKQLYPAPIVTPTVHPIIASPITGSHEAQVAPIHHNALALGC